MRLKEINQEGVTRIKDIMVSETIKVMYKKVTNNKCEKNELFH